MKKCLAVLWKIPVAGAVVIGTQLLADPPVPQPLKGLKPPTSHWPQLTASAKKEIPKDTTQRRLRKRALRFALHLGVQFSEFSARNILEGELNTLINNDFSSDSLYSAERPGDSLRIQRGSVAQSYDPVMVFFPLGVSLSISVLENLDVIAVAGYFVKEHSALWQDYPRGAKDETLLFTTRKERFGIQTWLGGLGVRYFIPPTWLTLNGKNHMYISYTHLWNTESSEFYRLGTAKTRFKLAGTGFEIFVGMPLVVFRAVELEAELGMSHLEFSSSKTWGDITVLDNESPLEWNFNSLVFRVTASLPTLKY